MARPNPAGTAALRAPARTLDPRVGRLWALQGLAGVLAVAVVAAVALGVLATADRLGRPALAWSLLAGGAAIATALAVGGARLRHRAFAWEVTPLGLFVQRGWAWRRWTIVPHSRIQAVETSVGPLQRRLGLATVQVRTASGEGGARLPGLAQDMVAALSAELAAAAGPGDAT